MKFFIEMSLNIWYFLLYLNLIHIINSQLLLVQDLPKWHKIGSSRTSGYPLILTSLLESGDDMTARKLARVDKSLFYNLTSYAGYINVDQTFNSNLWFWYFPSAGTEYLYDETYWGDDGYMDDNIKKKSSHYNWNNENRPLVLWLQGGPGASSLFGLFTEIGPFIIDPSNDLEILLNNNSWHKKYNLLFLDNPVGTGFSFTDADGYTKNSDQIGKHLLIFLKQFFKLFPWLKSVPFYVAGESYAGKYIPSIGYEIYKHNEKEDTIINLKGLALGNALSDPINMINYADFVYQFGLVDENGHREIKIFEYLARQHIEKKEGWIYWSSMLETFRRLSRYENYYNLLVSKRLDLETYVNFVDQPKIRKALHVGFQEFKPPVRVYFSMLDDFMNSVMHKTEYLLEHGCQIMYYSGNLDMIVAYPLSENAFLHMKWSKIGEYLKAKRKPFYVNGNLAGYVRKYENFADVLVLNAGHMVPTDQPDAALQMFETFVNETAAT